MLLGALACLAKQKRVQARILILDQCYSTGVEQFCEASSNEQLQFQYVTLPPCGISRARNEAIRRSEETIVLFTEPDAHPDALWASYLSDTLGQGAAVAGGRIVPEFEVLPPIVAKSGLIRDLYSLLDLGGEVKPSEKVVGCNFGINRAQINQGEPFFDETYGRARGSLKGGEEVDLCRRVIEGGGKVMYDGRAVVTHLIGKERCTYLWLIRRIFAAGQSRAQLGGQPNPSNKVGMSWHTLLSLPLYGFYLLGYLGTKLGGVRSKISGKKGKHGKYG